MDSDQERRSAAEAAASVLAGVPPGTVVITREGETPIEWLEAGDHILTRDRGFEPVLWINRIKFERKELRQFPEFAPVRIKAGSISPGLPENDIEVSPRQLFLIRSSLAELQYGSVDVLVPAQSIGTPVPVSEMRWNARISYAQILMDSHQLIGSDGLWLGSLFTGTLALELNPPCALSKRLKGLEMRAARPVLDAEEGRALMLQIWEERAARERSESANVMSQVG